jgi:uncharacterized damage-inducible protein DinB
MTRDDLHNLYSFMIWGDRAILEAAKTVSEEAYHRPQPISAGSVHKQLAHCMGTQWIWLERWRGRSLPARPDDQFPTFSAIETRWPQIHRELLDFLTRQTPESLQMEVAYLDLRGQPVSQPLFQQMLHVADHASYHRGQLNTMIHHAGGTPVMIMYWLFVQQGCPQMSTS